MRHLTLVGVVMAFGVVDVAAEERQVGVKLGPSFSVVAFEPVGGGDYDRRVAVGGGGFVVLPVARRLAVQIEGLFSPRGARLYDPDEDLTGTVLLSYVDVPVLLRIDGPVWGSRSLHLFAGPYAGVRVGATRQVSFSGGGFTSGVRTDMSREVERVELGLTGGVGLQIGRRFLIDGRYGWGLTPLNRDASDGSRVRNRALSLLAGARF